MRRWIFSTGPFTCTTEVSLLSVGCTSITHQFITFTVGTQKGDADHFFSPASKFDGLTLPHQPLVIHYRETMPEGFWFADLLKLGVLGSKACDGSEQEIAEKQAWLRQWGYGEGSSGNRTTPFSTEIPGLLAWPNGSTNGGEGCTGR